MQCYFIQLYKMSREYKRKLLWRLGFRTITVPFLSLACILDGWPFWYNSLCRKSKYKHLLEIQKYWFYYKTNQKTSEVTVYLQVYSRKSHWVKSVRVRSFSDPYFPALGLNAETYRVNPYSFFLLFLIIYSGNNRFLKCAGCKVT